MRRKVREGPNDPRLHDASAASVPWIRLRAWLGSRRHGRFDDVEAFCCFLGYARSGHTLIGSLLNAHPDVVVSHELNAVWFVDKGFDRRELFWLILQRDGQFEAIGRQWTGYDYAVPGLWQGRTRTLRVIGDKRGRSTSLLLGGDPGRVDTLRDRVEAPLRVIHHSRNPFDNITAEARRRSWSLARATEWYEENCRAVAAARPRLAADELFDLSHERFVAQPAAVLGELCRFLGVDPAPDVAPDYLATAAATVWPSARRRRDGVPWPAEDRHRVEALIDRYDFLAGYTFDG